MLGKVKVQKHELFRFQRRKEPAWRWWGEKEGKTESGGARNLNINWLKGYSVSIFFTNEVTSDLKVYLLYMFHASTKYKYRPLCHLAGVLHGATTRARAPLQELDKQHPEHRLVLGRH